LSPAPTFIHRSADLSSDGVYRYALRRVWDPNEPAILFVGLNPSTADHRVDDPTIRRCMRFARESGFGQLIVANLFAFRTSSPQSLRRAADPVGPENDRWLQELSVEASVSVAAWGNGGTFLHRDRAVLELLRAPLCLGVTKRGHPKHPLYVPAAARLRDLTA
jgi:hypothetical protein